jgi:hypothetical protein
MPGEDGLGRIRNEAIDSALKEVKSIRKVLAIAVGENERYRDHVQLLGAEIDGLRVVVQKKQDEVLKAKRLTLKRDETIKEVASVIANSRARMGIGKRGRARDGMLLSCFVLF